MKRNLIIPVIACICIIFLKCSKSNNDTGSTNSDNHHYQLDLVFDYNSWPAVTFNWSLTDKATLDLDVINGIVSNSNIVNANGTVLPESQMIQSDIETCTATWIQGESVSGYINITDVKGEVYLGGNEKAKMTLHVISSNAKTPRFDYVCTRSGSISRGGDPLEANEYFYTFFVNNDLQVQTISSLTATLTPK